MPQTLAEKIAEAVAEIGDVAKEGDNGEYTYIRSSDLFREVRHRLFKRGIVIVPKQILKIERSQPYLNVTENIIDEVAVTVEYTITDGTETWDIQSAGCGQDYKGKALPIALTGALKSLLKVLGLIAATEDDPETVNESHIAPGLAEKIDEMVEKCGDSTGEWPISRRDVIAWGQACVQSKIRASAREAYLARFGIDKISDLKRKDFKQAMTWATYGFASMDNIQDVIEQS
jgi:hypothetical protein